MNRNNKIHNYVLSEPLPHDAIVRQRAENTVNQHSIYKSVFLHLFPGIVFTVILFLTCIIVTDVTIPRALIFYALALLILVPMFIIIIKINEREKGTGKYFYDYIRYLEKISIWKVFGMVFLAALWAVVIFVLGKPLNSFFHTHLFSWMGNKFDISDYLTSPQNYSKGLLITTWVVGLFSTSLIVPIFEEIYFRGYLLPRIDRYKIFAPIIGTILFCLYHFFTPWMFLVRVIAIMPMIFLVWKYKNIHIGIVFHVLLNLLGDTITAIPIIFK